MVFFYTDCGSVFCLHLLVVSFRVGVKGRPRVLRLVVDTSQEEEMDYLSLESPSHKSSIGVETGWENRD